MKVNYSARQIVRSLAVGASLVGIITAIGFGCGKGFEPLGGTEFSSTSPLGIDTANPNDGGIAVVVGQKTVAVSNYTSVLDTMTSMTGVAPSQVTTDLFNNKLGSFSENGSAGSINAPMLFAYVSVGAEVCNDLVENERVATARRFYPTGMNLTTGGTTNATTALSDAVIADITRRFARQFWQRNETPEELAMMTAGVREMIAASGSPTAAGLTRKAGLYLCTAAIASTSAYVL